MRSPTGRHLRAVLLGAALLLPGSIPALAGDPVVARTLLESGRKAVAARKYDEAVPLLRRAQAEDPGLAEAVYWIGVVSDRQKDDAGSLAAYREYLALLEARGGEGSAEEKKLRSLAEKRVDVLAAGEKELRKLEERVVDELMDFARLRSSRDPGIALQALERLLSGRPDHDAALTLREKLGGKPRPAKIAAAGAGKEIAAVRIWLDFLADRTISGEHIRYEGNLMEVDTKSGTKILPKRPLDLGEAFAFEMEVRAAEVYDSGWLTGLTFADASPNFLAAFFQRSRIVLLAASETGSASEVAVHEMPAVDPAVFHRFGIVVRGKDLEIWLDGSIAMTHRFTDRPGLKGEIGIYQQGCRTERRVFRGGKL